MSGFLESGWYDKGGIMPPGLTEVRNETGQPIVVATAEQIRAGLEYMKRTYGGSVQKMTDPYGRDFK